MSRFAQLLVLVFTVFAAAAADKPNIVLIYADDLGYGDVSCYGATKISTPNVDRLAREGLRFTDAHSSAATCTPSRYAMLTGEHAFRKRGTGVLPGNAPIIIEPGRLTLGSLLQKAGYKTAVVGKWHLGLGRSGVDWNGEIKPGPREVGFDYSFLMPATGDRVPCVYVENSRVVGLSTNDPLQVSFAARIGTEPTGQSNADLLRMKPSHGHDQGIVNGVSRIGYSAGGKSAQWIDEEMADVFVKKAVAFIDENKAAPFFLFFSTHDVHVPRLPHARFLGKSGMGPRGDALLSFDWSVGAILDALTKHKLDENTLVILTSDNGPVVDDGYRDDAVEKLNGHKPGGPFRGGKYSAFEAGTRVPFIVRWTGRVKPGTSAALMTQVDLLASFAALTGQGVNTRTAPDTQNALPALLGETPEGRAYIIEQAGALSIRQGPWKYIEPRQGPKKNPNVDIELGNDPSAQLYNLVDDPGETKNLAHQRPGKVMELEALLAEEKTKGMAGGAPRKPPQ